MSTRRTIPKFGSFKPKDTAEGLQKDTETTKELDHDRHGRRGRSGHGEHRRHKRHRSRSQEKSESQLVEADVPKSKAAEVNSHDTSLFVVDRRGDRQNLVYGSIHRYDIPVFHRVGAGNVLGAHTELKVERKSSDDKGIVLTDAREGTRVAREKYAFARNEKKAPKLLRIRPDLVDHESTASNVDFIPLRTSIVRKLTALEHSSRHSSEDEEPNYRSIEGKAKTSAEPLDEDLEWVTNLDSSDSESGKAIVFNGAIRKKNVELSREVDKNPEDIEAWIALINHQDSLLGYADEGRRKVTNAEKRSMADIKIHMYEKALEKAGNTLKKRERLLLGLMAEGAKIWDFKTQTEKWEQVSMENLNSILLWKQCLDFRQSAFTQFRQEELRSIYMKRIKLLNEAITKRASLGHGDDEQLYEYLIYILLRATLFLRESGYVELAVAIWQALLELNLFCPEPLPPLQSKLELFQKFWDSEVPRVGEEGAKGWSKHNEADDVPDPKVDEETPTEYLESEDVFKGWAAAEKIKAAESRIPARTLDDTTEDDPYRVILWSDIQVFTVDLSYGVSRMTTSRLLLDAFLIFCRLPPIPGTHDLPSRNWWSDPFIRGELVDCSKSWAKEHFLDISTPNMSSEALSVSAETDGKVPCGSGPFQWPFHHIAGSPDTMFTSEQWANYFLPWKLLYSSSSHSPAKSEGPISYGWMRNALKIILDANIFEDFAEYYLAFEACNEPENAKKVAKSLLKQNPTSVSIYNAYAMIERFRGNNHISVNVLAAALRIRDVLPKEERVNSIILWKTWIWALLEDGDINGALRCLISSADGEAAGIQNFDVPSPAIRLRARVHLTSNRDYLVSSGDLRHGIIYAECLALMEYLMSDSIETSSHSQGDIASTLTVFEKFSEDLMARNHCSSVFHELLLQSAARLLYYHARSGPFRPTLIRAHLLRSLTLFPRNTIFLSLYAWNESRLRIDDRVRTVLRSVVLTEAGGDNIINRLFAIRYEMQAGNVHSTRAAFENAIASPACKSNPGLWRLYLLFCASKEQLGPTVRETFYRGMTACPWAKDYFMMAFTDLREFINMEDLIAIYRVVGEKELRIHVDIDERLADL